MAATIKNDNSRMHKPNPAKFYVPLYFQHKNVSCFMFFTLNYRDFFFQQQRKLEKRLFPKFSRENQPVLSNGITSPLIWKLIIDQQFKLHKLCFLRENPLNKGVNNKSVDMFNIITHRKHRRIGIMEYVTEESRDIMVTGSHKLRFRKKTGYLQTCYQLVNILVYSTKSMGQKSSNQYHQFKNCPVYQQ